MNSSRRPQVRVVESGQPWLGEIPHHWLVLRGKSQFRRVVRPVRQSDETVTCFRDGTVTLRRNRRLVGFTEALKEAGYQGIEPGDLVIHAMDAFAGAVGISDSRGKASPVYAVCEPIGHCSPAYAALAIRVMARRGWIEALSTGIRERSTDFRFNTFGVEYLPVPPADEQSAIVRFLGEVSQKTGRAIAAKRAIIALLTEKKQILVDDAVTRGLQATVLLKPSGIPWMRDIPAHWAQRPLWSICRERKEQNWGGLPLLSVFLNRGVIPYGEGGGQVHAPSLDLSKYQVVRPGDLVLNNQQAWRGSVGVSTHMGIISPAYIVLELREILSPEFAGFLFRSRSMTDQLLVASKGVGDIQRQVFKPYLRRVQVPIPPFEEQTAIAAFLTREVAGIDSACRLLEREVALLEEYLTRLSFDVVTGKIDVPEAEEVWPTLDANRDALVASIDDVNEPAVLEDAE